MRSVFAIIMAVCAMASQGCVLTTDRQREPVFEVRPSVSQADCANYQLRDGQLRSDVVNCWQFNVTVSPVDDHCLHGATFRLFRRNGGAEPRLVDTRVDEEKLFAEDRRRFTLVAFIDASVIGIGDEIIVECNANGDRVYVIFTLDCPDRFEIVKIIGLRRHFRYEDHYWFRFNPGSCLIDPDEPLHQLASASNSSP